MYGCTSFGTHLVLPSMYSQKLICSIEIASLHHSSFIRQMQAKIFKNPAQLWSIWEQGKKQKHRITWLLMSTCLQVGNKIAFHLTFLSLWTLSSELIKWMENQISIIGYLVAVWSRIFSLRHYLLDNMFSSKWWSIPNGNTLYISNYQVFLKKWNKWLSIFSFF